jgi:hypothetical protein
MAAVDTGVLFDILGDESPMPDWLADLAEGVAGWRIDEYNVLRSLTKPEQSQRIERVKGVLTERMGDMNRWIEFGRWYLFEDASIGVSPYSSRAQ